MLSGVSLSPLRSRLAAITADLVEAVLHAVRSASIEDVPGEHRWHDIELLDETTVSRARHGPRDRLVRVRTSKHWIAGYPELVARWHRTTTASPTR